jgi:excinuclease ABC subunit A
MRSTSTRPGTSSRRALRTGRSPESSQDFFLFGTNGDRVQLSYRNRFGRRRSYATTFEGIVPNLERRYRETDSDFAREKIEEYMTLRPCPECKGARLRPESRAVLVSGTPIHEFTGLSARRALDWCGGSS